MRSALLAKIAGVILLAGVTVRPASADFISTTLGAAGPANWTVLEIGRNGNISISGPSPPASIVGNVGINGTGQVSNSAVPIIGNLYLNSGASTNDPGAVTGTIFTNQNSLLSQATTAATNASTTFAALAPTLTVPGGAVSGTTTINGLAGINI
jgi:hypothetical protein